MASGIHKKIKIKQDDTVILSSNSFREMNGIAKIINNYSGKAPMSFMKKYPTFMCPAMRFRKS